MPRLSRCLSNAFPDPHCACSMIPVTHPNPHTNYNYFQLTWAVIGCLCFTSGDSYQASGDRSQPNLFAWHRKKRCTACQHILCAWKNMLRHSQYNQPWIKWPSAWHMWKAVHYIGLFLWKHPSYGADLNNSNIKEVWLIYCFFFINNALFHEKLTCLVFGFRLTCDSSFPQPPLFILPPPPAEKKIIESISHS